MVKPSIIGPALLIQSLLMGCYALNQATYYPNITCYQCRRMQNCDSNPQDSDESPTLIAPMKFESWAAWANRGLVLPQRPYCFSYISQVRMPDGSNTNIFGRGAGHLGAATPIPCWEERTSMDTAQVFTRYIFCPTSYCNTITKSQLGNQCFTAKELRSLQINQNNTAEALRTTISQRIMLPGMAVLVLRAAYEMTSAVPRIARAATVILSLLSCVSYIQALRCYACKDPLWSYERDMAAGYPVSDCYNSTALLGPAQQEDCNEFKIYPLYAKQKGYCATWIQERNGVYIMERGCVYPGGEPDDCLAVNGDRFGTYANGSTQTIRFRWTAQYCADRDFCNNINFADFVYQCFTSKVAGGTTPAIPRDLNSTDYARYTTPTFIRPSPGTPMQDTVLIQAQIIIAKIRAGNTSDLNITRDGDNGHTRHLGITHNPVGFALLVVSEVLVLPSLVGHRGMS
ncbi:uncharacterized protein LOC129602376 isoform X2 [Paramacrobiotus metropolitanus]|uniref:uncharacterized protein LOC129602376 isoform X2 n=1 Tax=Paramacrobiotus metropolitanus TaxID=2943436 RepID=UPI0024461F44|nr:uncharacterized protein LOC129602376 isoform X2 [Paramacrobiotus metropolitanus]